MSIKVDLPYPSKDEVQEDRRSAYIISPAYAGYHGELSAVLQYIYHYFYFNALGDHDSAKKILGIAICEMEHLEILGELLIKLGVDPIFTRYPPIRTEYYSAKALSYSKSPIKMLLDDISGEMTAITEYEKMDSALLDERVSAIIKRIALDEKLHVKVLKEMLEKYKK